MIMADKKLLAVKANLKRKQPVFRRQQAAIRKKLKAGWRKPKGLHSKMKDGLRGYPKALRMGYRTPVAVRGMTKHGLFPVRVERPEQLAGLDPKQHALVLGKVGARKKIMIIEQAQKEGFTLTNATQETAARLQAVYAARKRAKQAAAKEKLEEKLEAEAAKAEESKAEGAPEKAPDEPKAEKPAAIEKAESTEAEARPAQSEEPEAKPKRARKPRAKKSTEE